MALKLIHTADWHLGQTFFGYDREAEHEAFLGFLTNLLVERQTDVLLIVGDVFDVTNPSAGAQRRFYRFLREANRLNPGLQIVIIAGNHDSAIRLEAPNPLLEELNTSIVGIVGRTDSGEIDLASLVVPLRNRAGEREALCLAVPFLRQGDYPAAPEGELDSVCGGHRPDVPAALRLCRCPEESRRGDRSLGTPPRYRSRTIGGRPERARHHGRSGVRIRGYLRRRDRLYGAGAYP